jgi:hypothetical protein
VPLCEGCSGSKAKQSKVKPCAQCIVLAIMILASSTISICELRLLKICMLHKLEQFTTSQWQFKVPQLKSQ